MRGWRAKSSHYLALIFGIAMFPLVVTSRTRLERASLAGADAVLVQKAAQAEQLAVGGGELLLEFADRGAAGVTFLAELGCEDVHDVVLLRGCGLCGGTAGGPGGLLGAELLDALPQFGAGVEEIEADPGGPGN